MAHKLFFLVTALGFFFAVSAQAATLSGRVRSGSTPVKDVDIQVDVRHGAGWKKVGVTKTNSAGQFSMPGVDSTKTHRVQACKWDFLCRRVGIAPADMGKFLEMTLPINPIELQITGASGIESTGRFRVNVRIKSRLSNKPENVRVYHLRLVVMGPTAYEVFGTYGLAPMKVITLDGGEQETHQLEAFVDPNPRGDLKTVTVQAFAAPVPPSRLFYLLIRQAWLDVRS